MTERAKIKPPSNYLHRLLFDSPEGEEIEEKLDQIVKIADSLIKLLIHNEYGYCEYSKSIIYDADVYSLIEGYSKQERDIIINNAIRQYFEKHENV
ncbi:hypothetical protein H0A35_04765 [Bacillus licheniformis]|uniref:hypothetical protein n=1 Tax=Bacillus licheniformis TaxID=1402 RepID=UPI0011A6A388|nr:hypothetical protein [Bacillus licheniformis]MBA1160327.1 hypothetical protein [Bacillus licheniformis]